MNGSETNDAHKSSVHRQRQRPFSKKDQALSVFGREMYTKSVKNKEFWRGTMPRCEIEGDVSARIYQHVDVSNLNIEYSMVEQKIHAGIIRMRAK